MPLTEEELLKLHEQLIAEKQRLLEMETDLAARELDLEGQTISNQRQSDENPTVNLPTNPGFQNVIGDLTVELDNIKRDMTLLSNRVHASHPLAGRAAPINPQNTGNSDPDHPRLSFKDILEGIPTFNGENISVLKFVRACKRAKDMFPANLELTLTRLLRNKLKGRAYTAMEDDSFADIKAFTDRLKDVFGASKSLNQYRGELGNIAKHQSEHIIDYISRVKDLHAAITEEEKLENGATPRGRLTTLENETLDCFIAGLPPDFRLRLRLEGCTTLASAYANAVKIEKEIEKDRVNFRVTGVEIKKPSQTHVKTIAARESLTCENCHKKGHKSDDCWSKFPEKRPQRPRTDGTTAQHNNVPNKTQVWDKNRDGKPRPSCEYCAKLGHVITQCFKKQNDEKRNTGNANPRSENPGANRAEKPTERPVRTVNISNETSVPSTSA